MSRRFKLEHLKDYYPWLDEVGFQNKWIRTDYKFESIEEAEELSRFFFGDELGNKVRENNWVILPECTGVWWLKICRGQDIVTPLHVDGYLVS
jgi:hypothetical protein